MHLLMFCCLSSEGDGEDDVNMNAFSDTSPDEIRRHAAAVVEEANRQHAKRTIFDAMANAMDTASKRKHEDSEDYDEDL